MHSAHYRATAFTAALLTTALPTFAANTYQLQIVSTGLSNPVFATYAPGDPNHLYVLERAAGSSGSAATTGEIRIVDLSTHASSVFLDIPNIYAAGEEGALGLAFDPNYAANGKFYINVSTPPTAGNFGVQNIIEYHRATATTASPAADGTLLSWAHPISTNHKGGWIGFSPEVNPLIPGTTIRPNDEGNLYIATGDGSYPLVDGGHNAQSLQTDLGKILRIHINPATATYSIPATNPLANSGDPTIKKEIFAYGLRNPFRDSFDRATGTLYIGDVGLDSREEVDVQTLTNPTQPINYEWPYREGNIQTPGSTGGPLTGAANETGPIIEYGHQGVVDPTLPSLIGQCIIGGYVYRGPISELNGTYFFGDLLSHHIYSFQYDGTTVSALTDWSNTLGTIPGLVSFGEDLAGNLYIVSQPSTSGSLTTGGGTIYMLASIPEPATSLVALTTLTTLTLKRRRSRSRQSSSRSNPLVKSEI